MSLCAAQSPPLQGEHPPHTGLDQAQPKGDPGFQAHPCFSHQIEQVTVLADDLENFIFFL